MEIKYFKYSAGQMLYDAAALFFVSILLYLTIIKHDSTYRSWLLLGAFMTVIVARFIYLSVVYFIPCLKDKIAIELDEEKLQFFISGVLLFQKKRSVIYWKDVQEIEFISPMRRSAIISFTMSDGGDDAGISTKYISGNDKDIYNSIMEYYQKR